MELEKLFFGLGLDTKDMDKAWDAAMKKYGSKAKIDIKVDVAAINKAKEQTALMSESNKQILSDTKTREGIEREINKTKAQSLLAEEKIRTQAEKTNSIKQKTLSHIEGANNKIKQQGRLMQNLNTLAASYISIFAASRFVRELVSITGEFEMQRVSLQAILQDLEGANKIFDQIKQLAVKSPFQFKDIISYTKQLSAFSIPMGELYDTTKMLSDVSAGLGVGMDRLVLAYGQIRAASVLRGQEIRQLTEAGIPVIEELRKKFEELGETGITAADVFNKVSARLVPFSMIKEMFEEMTAEGGKFYMMQEIQAETLKGQVSNLVDAYQIMMSEIGGANDGVLKDSVGLLRDMMDNYEEVGKRIVELVAVYGTYRTALIVSNQVKAIHIAQTAAMTAGTKGLTATQIIATRVQNALNKSVLANPYVMAAAAVAALGYGIYKWTTYQTDAIKVQERANEAHEKAISEYIREEFELAKLYDKLGKATKGTKEYDDVRDVIQRKYGDYLKNLQDEKGGIIDVTDAYDYLKTKIKEVSMERAQVSFTQEAETEYSQALAKAIKETGTKIKQGITEGLFSSEDAANLSMELGNILRGEKSLLDLSEKSKKNYQALLTLSGKNLQRTLAQANTAKGIYQESLKQAKLFYSGEGLNQSADFPPKPDWLGKGWLEDLARYTISIDKKFQSELFKRAEESPEDFISRLRDSYADASQKLKFRSELKGEDIADLERKVKALKGAFDAMGIKPEEGKGGITAEKDPMVAVLEARATLLQEVQANYEKLSESMGDSKAMDFIAQLYSDAEWLPFGNMSGGLDNLIIGLRTLGDEGEKAADKLEIAIKKAYNAKEIKKATDEADKWKKKRDEITELVKKHAPLEEKINTLMAERDDLLKSATTNTEKGAINAEYQARIDALQQEIYQLTDLYQQLFDDWNDMGTESLKNLLQKTKEAVDSVKEQTTASGKTEMLVSIDGKDIRMSIRDFNSLKKKLRELEDVVEKDSPFEALSKHIKTFDKNAEKSDKQDWFKKLANHAQDALDYIKPLGDAMVGLFESMGNEGAADAAQLGMDLAQTAVDVGTALASGNYVQAAAGIIKGITQVFAYHDKKMQRLIEASQRRIADLEMAYNRLSRAMDRALGEDRYKYGAMQYRNLIAQTNEIEKQIKLEERKRKTDKEAVQSMRSELQDLRYQAQDLIIEMREELLGGDMRSLAQQFGDTIFDAIMNGNDAAKELKGTVDSMIQNIAKNMLMQKLIEKPLDSIISKYSNSWISPKGDFLGFDRVLSDLPNMSEDMLSFGEGIIPIYEQLMSALGWDKGSNTDGGMGAAIKGVTEDTANLLGSYINAIRADVSINKGQISTMVREMGDVNRALSSAVGYLADITQNTFRSANNSTDILNKLNELTRSGGATKLNVVVKTS